MRSMHSRSHCVKVDMCKLEHSVFSLNVSLVPLTCHVLIFCILNPPLPFHVSSHQRGSERSSLSFAKTLSVFYPVTLLLAHQNPSPLHCLDHIIQCLKILYHLLPACETSGSLYCLLSKVQRSHCGTRSPPAWEPVPPWNINILYVNRRGSTPGLI